MFTAPFTGLKLNSSCIRSAAPRKPLSRGTGTGGARVAVCGIRPTDARGNERGEPRAAARSFVYCFLAVRVGTSTTALLPPLLLGGACIVC
jgi:hypothetical protein